MIGKPLPRLEDAALLRGRGRFIDDIDLANELHAAFVRSPYAHADVGAIDASEALALPGVAAVLTAADLAADGLGEIRETSALRSPEGDPANLAPRPLLARERVRHVGEAVAMVLAETRDAAREAAELVMVDYDEREAVVDGHAALADDAPALFDSVPGNLALRWEGGDRERAGRAFGAAAHVVRLELVNNRVVIAPMEVRGVLAEYDTRTERYTVYAPSQGVQELRAPLAAALGVPGGALHVITPDVGGAFGIKIFPYPEYALAAWAARRVARPVKWLEDRAEAFLTDGQGRDHVTEAELALDADGRFLAIRTRTVSNAGAYASSAACTIPTAGGSRCTTGVYVVPAWHAEVRVAYSNTVPITAYRGAGKPEYNYVVERLVDAAARETGIDPAEIRRLNAVPPDAMPYATGTGLEFDCGEFVRNMDDALLLADRAGFETRRAEARERGRYRGFGFAMFQEPDGFLDNRVTMQFDAAGRLQVTITGQSGGHGNRTTFGQVAAERLGVPLETVRVIEGDSDVVGPGRGSGGSRVATVAGSGIVRASERIIDKAKRIAAHMLEASEADLEHADGAIAIAGTDRRLTLAEIAAASFDGARIPHDMEPGLEATSHYLAREYNYPCGCHCCEVEIDAETGALELVAYAAVDDHGVVINPLLLEGQIHGGIAQGVGQALLERCVYDEASGQLVTGSFMDYCLPRAVDFPSIALGRNCVPSRTNPLGVKGVGESGCTAAPPAVMNAVVDALAPLGVRTVDMPVTQEGLWRIIREHA